MHRVQRRTLKKRKDNNKRNGGKIGKNEGNISMSKRLTIPPDFFRSGIPPSEIQKPSGKHITESKEPYSVLDNFHGLFNKCLNIKRSERILNRCTQRNESTDEIHQPDLSCSNRETNGIVNESLSSNSLHETLNSQNYQNNPTNNRKGKRAIKKSKSIFEEINQLYAISSQNNFKNPEAALLENSVNEFNLKYSFCNSLFQQIDARFAVGHKTILTSKSKIYKEIKKIDSVLLGKTKMEKTPNILKINNFYIDDGNNDVHWKCFTQSEWVYNTPPRQKIIPPKFDHTQLQPAILCSNRKQKQLFEWKSNSKMDIGDFDTKDNIVVNHKYMEHTATVNSNMNLDIDMEPSLSQKKTGNSNNNMFNFPKPTLLRSYQRAKMINCKESNQARKTKHKSDKENNLDLMFPNYTETENIITENNGSSPIFCYEAKKRLFGQNAGAFGLINDVKMDCPSSSNSKENDFSFLKPLSPEPAVEMNFNFKSSSRNKENGNLFRFASDENNFI